jgi:hypothetical protein
MPPVIRNFSVPYPIKIKDLSQISSQFVLIICTEFNIIVCTYTEGLIEVPRGLYLEACLPASTTCLIVIRLNLYCVCWVSIECLSSEMGGYWILSVRRYVWKCWGISLLKQMNYLDWFKLIFIFPYLDTISPTISQRAICRKCTNGFSGIVLLKVHYKKEKM